jgi:hypothetical protein
MRHITALLFTAALALPVAAQSLDPASQTPEQCHSALLARLEGKDEATRARELDTGIAVCRILTGTVMSSAPGGYRPTVYPGDYNGSYYYRSYYRSYYRPYYRSYRPYYRSHRYYRGRR